jgi:hypothetical protein
MLFKLSSNPAYSILNTTEWVVANTSLYYEKATTKNHSPQKPNFDRNAVGPSAWALLGCIYNATCKHLLVDV